VYEFVALVIQRAKHMRRIILSSVASAAPPYFSVLCHKKRNFGVGGVVLNRKCVLIFSTNLFEIFLILRRIQRDIVINVKTSSCKVPVIPVGF
jgi:hypothetical protein